MNNNIKSYQTNVSPLINPDINSVLGKSIPKTFGDQVPVIGESALTMASNSKLGALLKEKTELVLEGIDIEIEHQTNLQKIEIKHTSSKKIENGNISEIPAELDDEGYRSALEVENDNYQKAKELLQIRKDQNEKNISELIKDPFKKIKEKQKERKAKRKESKNKNKELQRKAKRVRIKSSLKSASTSLVPLIPSLISILTNKIIEITMQNGKISQLVDNTNKIIIEANSSNDPLKLNNAKLIRDNAIKIIQDNESKITEIRNQIQRISIYVNIFSIVVQIISNIPIPTSVPPGIGIPVNAIMKLVKILDKASRIVALLGSIIPVLVSSLDTVINELEELKNKLLNINGMLEISSITTNNSLISNPNEFGTNFETYKGFKFALREDNKNTVRGFKRHYAVAIDRNNVEVLKSELSFTLDPQDLIETLKIIIDRENLIP